MERETEPVCRDLEVAVEKLSQLLQEEIKPETIKDLRQDTINKTVCLPIRGSLRVEADIACQVYVRQRHDLILEDTARRLSEGTWKWTISIE
jgi:ariadne-1